MHPHCAELGIPRSHKAPQLSRSPDSSLSLVCRVWGLSECLADPKEVYGNSLPRNCGGYTMTPASWNALVEEAGSEEAMDVRKVQRGKLQRASRALLTLSSGTSQLQQKRHQARPWEESESVCAQGQGVAELTLEPPCPKRPPHLHTQVAIPTAMAVLNKLGLAPGFCGTVRACCQPALVKPLC